MKWLVLFCAFCIIVEAVISLFWKNNDKWFWAQAARAGRIAIGVVLVWASFVI